MKLRLKVLLILAVTWAIISLIIIGYSRYLLTNEYIKLEKHEVIDDVDRTSKILNSLLSSVKLLNTDWSQWNDAYHFMSNKNQEFITSNMAFTTFENARINLILFFDPAGKLFFGLNYDLNAKKFIPIPLDLLSRLQAEKSFTVVSDVKNGKSGILSTPEGYVVLSALPILTSEGKGPARGTLIMGYFFSDKQIAKLAEIINMQVHFFPLPLTTNNPIINTSYQELQKGAQYYISAESNARIYGFTFIRDVDNKPIGILRITSPRDLYNQGLNTVGSYIIIVITIGIIFMALVWYLLRIFILDRVISVSQQVADINTESKFSKRIKISGKDELANLVFSINSLMEIIELTEEQLKYRIFLRTEELDNLSKLNKNLAKEMNQQKEIEVRLREGEKALRQMAYYDSLTGLPNRLYFYEILQKNIAKSDRDGTGIAILYMDADTFKNINDTYGHDMGDKFLKHTGHQLKSCLKESDIAARLAGDEFIICLSNIRGKNLINIVADKILRAVSTPLKVGDLEISASFSIGIAIYPENGKTIDELQKNADLAMYYAKKQKGNSYHYYDEIKNSTSTTN